MPRARKAEAEAGETGQLPGLEDQKNPRVHEAAIRYWSRMQERKAAGDEEVAAKDALVALMQTEGLTSYRFGDVEVHLDTLVRPKVTRKTPGEDDAGE